MKKALILERLDRGTILTSLQSCSYSDQLKILKSSVDNWESICKILEDDEKDELIVLAKFTEYVLFLFCLPQYKEVSSRLMKALKRKKHAIFIYHNNFVGEFSCNKKHPWHDEVLDIDEEDDFISSFRGVSTLDEWLKRECLNINPNEYEETVRAFVKDINKSGFNVIPYRKLVDIEVAGQNFIESIDQGLIFRVYVPNDRLWAKELDRFVILFRDYASATTNSDIKVVQNRTGKGVMFSLYSNDQSIDSSNIGALFDDFSTFLDLCTNDMAQATQLLERQNISGGEIGKIINRYTKEAKRLMIDLKHEREMKVLSIKHRFESEIFETEISEEIESYINNSVPQVSNPSGALLGTNQQVNASVVNITNNYIDQMEGIVANEVTGNIQSSPEDEQLRKLIENYVGISTEKTELNSALDELKDESLSSNERTVSWQKLQGFLGKVTDKVGDVGVQLLQKYLEQQLQL